MSEPYFITARALAERGRDEIPAQSVPSKALIYSSPATLSYNSPGANGFGVKRAGLVIPESVMLLVSPGCCGRNSTILSAEGGYSERMFYLRMDETDLVTGRHLEKIPQAVREIIEVPEKRPKVVLICITCVDALLGTDLERVCRKAEEYAGVRVVPSYMTDVILSHDRKIRLRADDSVTDFIGGKPYMIRRSRGYAPIPAFISGAKDGSALAVGGELKNTFCLTKGGLAYLSPYIGDLADLRSVRALEEAVERMLGLEPLYLACEGRLVVFTPEKNAEKLLEVLKRGKYSAGAARIGTVTEEMAGRVVVRTSIGAETLLPPPGGELLPRIC